MNHDQIDGIDDLRELRRLVAGLLHSTPGVARVASATPDIRPALTGMGRVSHEARIVVVACGGLIVGAVWATSTTFKLARALSRSTRR